MSRNDALIRKGKFGMTRHLAIILAAWTFVLAGLLGWRLATEHDTIKQMARDEARTIWDHNLSYRKWVTAMGGVYVRQDKMAPNPYLQVPDRDKTTTDGIKLTMANPAYMTTQVFAIIGKESDPPIVNRIVSDKFLNPRNKPDDWEEAGLRAFAKGVRETSEITELNGEPYLRLFKPMVTQEGCLKCHGFQGYQVGDIRGGISISIPMKPYYAVEAGLRRRLLAIYGSIWAVGCIGIFLFINDINRSHAKARRVEERMSRLFNAAAVPLCFVNRDGVLAAFNDRFTQVFGYTHEDVPTLAEWWQRAYPDPAYRTWVTATWDEAVLQAAQEQRDIRPVEYNVTCKDGTVRTMVISGSTLGDDFLATFFDVTERKRAEEALREKERHAQSLLRLSKRMELARTLGQVVEAARDEVKAVIGYQNLWVYLLSEDRQSFKSLIAGGSMSDTIMSEAGTATLKIAGDRMLEEIAEAKDIVVVMDARTDKRTDKQLVESLGNRTIVNIPIFLSDKKIGTVGTGTFGEEGVRPPTKSEEEYLRALASHLAVALDRISLFEQRDRAEEALRMMNEKLGQLVKDRTAELEAKNEELEKMNRLFVGRELRMAELKERIRELEENTQ